MAQRARLKDRLLKLRMGSSSTSALFPLLRSILIEQVSRVTYTPSQSWRRHCSQYASARVRNERRAVRIYARSTCGNWQMRLCIVNEGDFTCESATRLGPASTIVLPRHRQTLVFSSLLTRPIPDGRRQRPQQQHFQRFRSFRISATGGGLSCRIQCSALLVISLYRGEPSSSSLTALALPRPRCRRSSIPSPPPDHPRSMQQNEKRRPRMMLIKPAIRPFDLCHFRVRRCEALPSNVWDTGWSRGRES